MKIAFPGCHSQDIFCSQWPACHRALFCQPLSGRVSRARMAFQPGEREEGVEGGGVQQRQALFPNQDLAGTQHWSPGPQKAASHLPNSFSSSANPLPPPASTCLPSAWSVISHGLGLPPKTQHSQEIDPVFFKLAISETRPWLPQARAA